MHLTLMKNLRLTYAYFKWSNNEESNLMLIYIFRTNKYWAQVLHIGLKRIASAQLYDR